MTLNIATYLLVLPALLPMAAHAAPGETVANGGFEMTASSDRPRYWSAADLSTTAPSNSGEWAIDRKVFSEGSQSLRLRSLTPDGYYVSQIADGNSNFLRGTRVRASADVRVSAGAQASLFVLATNPELPPDPDYAVGLALKMFATASDTGGAFTTIRCGATAAGRAVGVYVFVIAAGTGPVWFDDISVRWEQPQSGPMPDPLPVEPAFDSRAFAWGIVNENPQNFSERAQEEMVAMLRDYGGDTLNIFCHVRYNRLTTRPLLDGYDQNLRLASMAKRYGLERVLTFDFTHASLLTLGDLNPMPDGTPPGSFLEHRVRDAMGDELLALARRFEPAVVFVGIEIDFFYNKHPEWWEAFVRWYSDVRRRLRSEIPGVRVSVYVTLGSLVKPGTLEFTSDGLALFHSLRGKLDLLAYSAYFYWDDPQEGLVPSGLFRKIRELDPMLPIALPELGVASHSPRRKDGLPGQRGQVRLLQQILDETAPEGLALATLYSAYDQTYLGVDRWFKDAFGTIGIHNLNGTPKLGAAWFVQIAERKVSEGR